MEFFLGRKPKYWGRTLDLSPKMSPFPTLLVLILNHCGLQISWERIYDSFLFKKLGDPCQLQSLKFWKFYNVKTWFLTIFKCHFEALRVFFFLKKCQKVDPPKIGHFRGGLLSDIFSKKHSKSLKLTPENRQKWGFYIVKFPNLLRLELACAPHFFDQKFIRMCYLYV